MRRRLNVGTTGTQGTQGTTGTATADIVASRDSRGAKLAAAALALVVVAGLAAWALGYVRVGRAGAGGAGIADITYQPITFDEGFVFAARFARDGRTVVYSADWENQQRDIFVTSLDSFGARPLGYKDADLLAVAPDGALAILVKSIIPTGNPYARQGTIARASLTGGAAREELPGVSFADFGRDGLLAVTREPKGGGPVIEWPQGKPIVDAKTNGASSTFPNPRLSPSADHVAYFTCFKGTCRVRIADNAGKTVAESRAFYDWWGLAWAPGGREVWFAVAETSGRQCTLFALDLTGRQRLILRVPGSMTVHDISSDGKVLGAFDTVTARLETRDTPSSSPRDLSWKEGGGLKDVSANGTLLFDDQGDSGGPNGSVYVRRPGDTEPLRISDGFGIALSDDGSTAVVQSFSRPVKLSLVPTSGLPQPLDVGPLESVSTASWLKDGRLVLELQRQPGEPFAVFVRPAAGGPIVPVLPPEKFLLGPRAIAPGGARFAAGEANRPLEVCTMPSTGMAACVPIPGTTLEDQMAGWTADGSAIFVYRRYPVPVKVERVDVATGRRTLYTTLQPASAAVSGLSSLFVTPAGALVYNYGRSRSALYVISGLK